MILKEGVPFVSEVSKSLMEQEGLESECHLSGRLDITPKDCAVIRRGHLRENYHWVLRNSTGYYYPDGVKELLRLVPPEKRKDRTPITWFGPPNDTPLSKTVVAVVRVPPNPRFVICEDGEGRPVSVRVNSNTRFLRGMRIDTARQCKRDWNINYADGRAVYQLTVKVPRQNGRW